MLLTRILALVFQRGALVHTILRLMGFGLIILADCLVTMVIASQIGAYLALALVAIATWVSVAIVYLSISQHVKHAQVQRSQALPIDIQIRNLLPLVISLVLMITPGFLSDVMGWLVYFYPIRLALGRILTRRWHRSVEAVTLSLGLNENEDS